MNTNFQGASDRTLFHSRRNRRIFYSCGYPSNNVEGWALLLHTLKEQCENTAKNRILISLWGYLLWWNPIRGMHGQGPFVRTLGTVSTQEDSFTNRYVTRINQFKSWGRVIHIPLSWCRQFLHFANWWLPMDRIRYPPHIYKRILFSFYSSAELASFSLKPLFKEWRHSWITFDYMYIYQIVSQGKHLQELLEGLLQIGRQQGSSLIENY